MRPKDIDELLDDIAESIMENEDLELPLDMLRPEEGSDEREAGLLTIPQEILDHVEQRGGSLEDHILGYLEAAIDLHNEGILLKTMVQLTEAAESDDYQKLADETGTEIRPDLKALLGFLAKNDPLGTKAYEAAISDIKSALLRKSAAIPVPEESASWQDAIPLPKGTKCHECGELLDNVPHLIVMGAIVSPRGKMIYGDGFASDSEAPPGLVLERSIPVCLECLIAHLSSDVVETMAKPRKHSDFHSETIVETEIESDQIGEIATTE